MEGGEIPQTPKLSDSDLIPSSQFKVDVGKLQERKRLKVWSECVFVREKGGEGREKERGREGKRETKETEWGRQMKKQRSEL